MLWKCKWYFTLTVYQKFKHSFLCSFPINPGDARIVVADLSASVSLAPDIAKYRLVFPVGSKSNENENY